LRRLLKKISWHPKKLCKWSSRLLSLLYKY